MILLFSDPNTYTIASSLPNDTPCLLFSTRVHLPSSLTMCVPDTCTPLYSYKLSIKNLPVANTLPPTATLSPISTSTTALFVPSAIVIIVPPMEQPPPVPPPPELVLPSASPKPAAVCVNVDRADIAFDTPPPLYHPAVTLFQ